MWVNATRSGAWSPTRLPLEPGHIVRDATLRRNPPLEADTTQGAVVSQQAPRISGPGKAGIVHLCLAPEISHKHIGDIGHARRLAGPAIDDAAIAIRRQF